MFHKTVSLAKKVSALIIIAAILNSGTSFATASRQQQRENVRDRIDAMRARQDELTQQKAEKKETKSQTTVSVKAPATGAVTVQETAPPKEPVAEKAEELAVESTANADEINARSVNNISRRNPPARSEPTVEPQPTPTTPPAAAPPPPVVAPPPAANSQAEVLGTVASAVFAGVNAERKKAGVAELSLAQDAVSMAISHSQEMAAAGELLNHADLKSRLQQFIKSYISAAENEAYNTVGTAAKAVSQWMNSASHRDSMLNAKYTKGGVGVVSKDGKYYYTLILYT